MALPVISGEGRLTEDPSLKFLPNGTAVADVSIAFNARKFNKDTQAWEDGDVLYLRGSVFKEKAEAVAESLQRGADVTVTGRLRTRSWEKDGEKRSVVDFLIDSIGPSLSGRQTAPVRKTERGSGSGFGGSQGAAQQQNSDPWATGSSTTYDNTQIPF